MMSDNSGHAGERDAVDEIWNLARHLYDESRTLGEHVRDSERHHGNELASAVYQARADAMMDAARELRELALYLDPDADRQKRPASLAHGEALGTDTWADGGGDDSDA